MHWPHRRDILFDNGFYRAAPFGNVAAQTPDEANIVGCVDKNFDVQLLEQSWIRKDQYSFDDNNWLGFYEPGFIQASVSFEVVDWQFNRVCRLWLAGVGDEQIGVERVGVVEGCNLPIVGGQVLEVTIIGRLRNENDFGCL